MALNFFSNCVTNLLSLTFSAPKRDIDFRVGTNKVGPLSSGGTHIAILEPCC